MTTEDCRGGCAQAGACSISRGVFRLGRGEGKKSARVEFAAASPAIGSASFVAMS